VNRFGAACLLVSNCLSRHTRVGGTTREADQAEEFLQLRHSIGDDPSGWIKFDDQLRGMVDPDWATRFLALLLYMWVVGVWYGSFRLTGPQASMTVASADSGLWKP
jgi:hypothetical protein